MQVLTTQRLVRSWSAWVGTKDELLRVVKLLEDETEAHKQSQIQRIGDQLPDRIDISDARLVRQRVGLREQTTSASVTERDGFKHFGSPTEAVERADIRVLRDVELDSSRSSPTDVAVVRFLRLEGPSLEVRGSADWVLSMAAKVGSEIERGVPAWRFLRNSAAWPLYGVVFGLIALAVMWPLAEANKGYSLGQARGFVALWAGFFGVWAGLGATYVVRRALPGFELHADGDRGSGLRVLGVVGTVLLTVVGALLSLFAST